MAEEEVVVREPRKRPSRKKEVPEVAPEETMETAGTESTEESVDESSVNEMAEALFAEAQKASDEDDGEEHEVMFAETEMTPPADVAAVDVEEPVEDEEEDPIQDDSIYHPEEKELEETLKREQSEIDRKVAQVSEKVDITKTKQIVTAGRRARKRLYGDEYVIPINDELQYESEGAAKRKEFLDLVASKKGGRIMTGTVIGTQTFLGKFCAVVKYGDYHRVIIPFEFFAQLSDHDMEYFEKHSKKECESQKRLLLNQRILSEVDFIVRAIDEAGEVFIGHRLDAMNRNFNNWYFQRSARDGKYAIREDGPNLEARVVFSSTIGMIVELHGKEYYLKQSDISYRRMADVSAEYPVGSTVPVAITSIERDVKSRTCKATVSVKEALPDPREKCFNMYQVGALLSAVVTGIDSHGIFTRIEDRNGKIDILCKFTDNQFIDMPKYGDTMLVRVEAKDNTEGKFRIYGSLVRKLKDATK